MKKLRRLVGLIIRLNVYKTLHINFKFFAFKEALNFPVFVFGKLSLKNINGRVIINDKIKTGMIQIGLDIDGYPESQLSVIFFLKGDLIFNGPAIISGGSNITIWAGQISIGKFCVIGSGSIFKAQNKITIGDTTRFAARSVVMDSDVHFVRNIDTGIIHRNTKQIIIGKYCWVNAGSVIAKGAIVPDYTIVGRNAILNKDYSNNDGPIFLVGSPAEVKSRKNIRIFGNQKEKEIKQYFIDNPEASILDSEILGTQDESDELSRYFNYFQ